MIVTGLAFGLVADLRGAPGGGRGRDDQPVVRRRQRVPPDRAGAAARHRADRPAHPRVRPLQPRGLPRRRVRRAGRRDPGLGRRSTPRSPSSRPCRACSSSTRWSGWRCSSPTDGWRPVRRSWSPGWARSGLGRSRAIVLRLSALFSLDAFGGGFAVQSILVLWLSLRFGLSTAQSGAVFFWSGLLTASSALLAPRHRRPHRPDPHDGVHAHPRQPAAHLRRADADGGARGGLPARPGAAVADGCARPHELRDGGGRPGGAHRGGDHHQRPPQPGLGPPTARGRLAAAAAPTSAGP